MVYSLEVIVLVGVFIAIISLVSLLVVIILEVCLAASDFNLIQQNFTMTQFNCF